MAPLGRALLVGNASEKEASIGSNMLWGKSIAVLGFAVGSYLQTNPSGGRPAAKAVLGLLAEGKLELPVTILPLADVAEAHRRLDAKEITGRIVLKS